MKFSSNANLVHLGRRAEYDEPCVPGVDVSHQWLAKTGVYVRSPGPEEFPQTASRGPIKSS